MDRNFKSFLAATLFLIMIFIFASASFAWGVDRNGYRPTVTPANSQVSCGTTATSIFSVNSSRKGWVISNNSGVSVYIGTSSVTTANGFELISGSTLSDGGNHPLIAQLYCRVGSGTATITVLEKRW